jgi:hypothetical protein
LGRNVEEFDASEVNAMIADCSNLIRDFGEIKDLLQRKRRGALTELERKHLNWALGSVVAKLHVLNQRGEGVLVRELQK